MGVGKHVREDLRNTRRVARGGHRVRRGAARGAHRAAGGARRGCHRKNGCHLEGAGGGARRGGRTLGEGGGAAARVAETKLWDSKGDRSPAHALARESGTSVGAAADAIETAQRLAEQPAL